MAVKCSARVRGVLCVSTELVIHAFVFSVFVVKFKDF